MMVVKAHVKDPGNVKNRGFADIQVTAVIIYDANALCNKVRVKDWTGWSRDDTHT